MSCRNSGFSWLSISIFVSFLCVSVIFLHSPPPPWAGAPGGMPELKFWAAQSWSGGPVLPSPPAAWWQGQPRGLVSPSPGTGTGAGTSTPSSRTPSPVPSQHVILTPWRCRPRGYRMFPRPIPAAAEEGPRSGHPVPPYPSSPHQWSRVLLPESPPLYGQRRFSAPIQTPLGRPGWVPALPSLLAVLTLHTHEAESSSITSANIN